MQCPYCSAANADEDHRCKRCGRRLGVAGADAPRYEYSAAAPELEREREPVEEREAPQKSLPRKPVYQPALFTTSRLVAFESFAPESVDRPVKKPAPPRHKPKKAPPGQQTFAFDPDAQRYQTVYQGPVQPLDSVLSGEARVAPKAHRMVAAACDLSLVAIGVGLFAMVFELAGGSIVLNRHTIPLAIGIACVVFLLYKLLWCFADTDTAGMRFAHLKLVDFDGKAPLREQRLCRVAAGFLSLLAVGLGLLWALVDEESLTWHDHISKTVPAARD